MNNKHLFILPLLVASAAASAQETYLDTNLPSTDLNGTARYVGMGGAMEALGADISTIASNPAGIGLFRRSQLTLSGGLLLLGGDKAEASGASASVALDGGKTHASFDQVGIVWVSPTSHKSSLNLAFQYHKSRNFNQLLGAAGSLGGASQSKQAAGMYAEEGYLQDKYGQSGSGYIWNAVDENYLNVFGKSEDGMNYLEGTDYVFAKRQRGYIGNYNLNISGNINNRVYLGLTFGYYDVHYKSTSAYNEAYVGGANAQSQEEFRMSGNGYDVKLGIIFRPVEASPFRIGAYIHTPTFYDLSTDGSAALVAQEVGKGAQSRSINSASLDFRVNTPWHFGLSLGHTVGNNLALGATWDYADYGSIDNRYINGDGYYNYWTGSYSESSSSDELMNEHTKMTLKGVHTLKLGVEYKPTAQLALRAGYNYVSPMFEKDGFRDAAIAGDGSATATSTDYTNWKATNRITLGVGYSMKRFFADLAYQMSTTTGDFYPVGNQYLEATYNEKLTPAAVKVHNDRHQLLLTLGYKL